MTKPWVIHIIDDDEAVRTSLVFALQAAGLRAHSHDNAGDFLALAETERGVLICDVRMPGMNGVELTRQLRQRGSTMPVVLITGNANRTLKVEAMDAGADVVLEKPVALAMLLTEIARVTLGWE
jgi:two-component system response regulator FixJ